MAGCVLVKPQSANTDLRVLVLEAGPCERNWKIHNPAALTYNLGDDRETRFYSTEPQAHLREISGNVAPAPTLSSCSISPDGTPRAT